jgi:carbon-monoxide dehydrogenase medium subunit
MTPLRARAAEAALVGQRLDEGVLRAAGAAAKTEVDPLSDHRGSAAYKREMVSVMVGRALTQAAAAARQMARGAR